MTMLEKNGYLTRIKRATKMMLSHPRHHGVKMQAHHAVSAKGVDIAGKSDELRQLGYNINDLKNLVFIPSTLQGACHLETQLHRGDHGTPDKYGSDDPEAMDSDKRHPIDYHVLVKDLVENVFIVNDLCKMNSEQVQKKINKVSKDIVKKINKFRIDLTSISSTFDSGKPGCMGLDNIPDNNSKLSSIRTHQCPVHRNHEQNQGQFQKAESIKYKKAKYILELGK